MKLTKTDIGEGKKMFDLEIEPGDLHPGSDEILKLAGILVGGIALLDLDENGIPVGHSAHNLREIQKLASALCDVVDKLIPDDEIAK